MLCRLDLALDFVLKSVFERLGIGSLDHASMYDHVLHWVAGRQALHIAAEHRLPLARLLSLVAAFGRYSNSCLPSAYIDGWGDGTWLVSGGACTSHGGSHDGNALSEPNVIRFWWNHSDNSDKIKSSGHQIATITSAARRSLVYHKMSTWFDMAVFLVSKGGGGRAGQEIHEWSGFTVPDFPLITPAPLRKPTPNWHCLTNAVSLGCCQVAGVWRTQHGCANQGCSQLNT